MIRTARAVPGAPRGKGTWTRVTGTTLAYSPDTVEDGAVREDADVDIGHDDVVEVALLLVGEEQVRHPYPGGVRQSQVLYLSCKRRTTKRLSDAVSAAASRTQPPTESGSPTMAPWPWPALALGAAKQRSGGGAAVRREKCAGLDHGLDHGLDGRAPGVGGRELTMPH